MFLLYIIYCIYIHFMIKCLFTLQWVTHLSGHKYRVAIRLNLSYYLISVEITRRTYYAWQIFVENSAASLQRVRANARVVSPRFIALRCHCFVTLRWSLQKYDSTTVLSRMTNWKGWFRSFNTRDFMSILCILLNPWWFDDFKPTNIA